MLLIVLCEMTRAFMAALSNVGLILADSTRQSGFPGIQEHPAQHTK